LEQQELLELHHRVLLLVVAVEMVEILLLLQVAH
jgi:hypothetical protein